VCFQPEFLREGSSIRDYDRPPYTIVGASGDAAVARLKALFGHLPCEFHATSIRAAETVKYCCNNFHALKITFANETARLCEALGVDPFEVMDLVCKDTQLNISKAYCEDARRRAADAREHPAVEPCAHRPCDREGACLGQAPDRHDRTRVQDRDRRPAREPVGPPRRAADREERLPHIGALIRRDLESVVAESELLVLGLSDAGTLEKLRGLVRDDQIVLDLARAGDPARLRGTYEGLCW
jgi:GDP-mannose 6-dehydrogenase